MQRRRSWTGTCKVKRKNFCGQTESDGDALETSPEKERTQRVNPGVATADRLLG